MLTEVIKNDGTVVQFDAEKLNKMAEWASNVGICWSTLVLDAVKKVNDRCTTTDLQNALIDACAERETPEHLAMAARLYLGTLYKGAHGGFEVERHLYDFYHDMVSEGVWEAMMYDASDLEYLNSIIDHSKDVDYRYSTIKQLSTKYSARIGDRLMETPQFTFMGIAMKVAETMPESRRIEDVAKLYTYLSDLKINAPTPFLAGIRTLFKGYASCALFTADDDAKSLSTAVQIAYDMTCASAGLGGTFLTRSTDDWVRNKTIKHYGKLPYYRFLEGAVKSTKQSSRGGSATMHFTLLDPEVETLLRLKHPTTVADRKIRGLDYSAGGNRFFSEKANKREKWMLVSYQDGRELHEALYGGYEGFKKAYEEYEASDKPRKYVEAIELLLLMEIQRQDVGRVYKHWLDEMNTHTPFKDKIYSSNL